MRRNDLLLSLFGALMLALSRLPLNLGWLVFFAWLPYLYMFERGFPKRRQLLGVALVTSLVFNLIVFYWFAMVTVPGLIGMVLLYTFIWYAVFLGIELIFRRLQGLRYLGFIALLISFEYVQNFGETRFPWFNLAYSLADYNVLIQFADLFGVVGLSILIICVNLLLHQIMPTSRRVILARRNSVGNVLYPEKRRLLGSLLGLLTIFALWIGYGLLCLEKLTLQEHDARIFVMQPSIDQEVKWDVEQYRKSLDLFQNLTLHAAADSARLVIWPEGAVTDYLASRASAQMDLHAILDTAKVEVFTGFPQEYPAPPGHVNPRVYYNSASLYRPNDFSQKIYHKNILVPVAERMLWLDQFPFMWKLQFGQANWEFGKELRYYESGGFAFSPSICYELAFPGIFHRMAIPRDSVTHAYRKSSYLVNITNDAWFGTSYGPWLHAVMARFRAVENRIQIYRSANTGISLIVDPKGQILAQTKLFEVRNITAPLRTTPKVPLIRRIHLYPLLLVALAIVLILMSLFNKNERQL